MALTEWINNNSQIVSIKYLYVSFIEEPSTSESTSNKGDDLNQTDTEKERLNKDDSLDNIEIDGEGLTDAEKKLELYKAKERERVRRYRQKKKEQFLQSIDIPKNEVQTNIGDIDSKSFDMLDDESRKSKIEELKLEMFRKIENEKKRLYRKRKREEKEAMMETQILIDKLPDPLAVSSENGQISLGTSSSKKPRKKKQTGNVSNEEQNDPDWTYQNQQKARARQLWKRQNEMRKIKKQNMFNDFDVKGADPKIKQQWIDFMKKKEKNRKPNPMHPAPPMAIYPECQVEVDEDASIDTADSAMSEQQNDELITQETLDMFLNAEMTEGN